MKPDAILRMVRVTIDLERDPAGGWLVHRVWLRLARNVHEVKGDREVYRSWRAAETAARRMARQRLRDLGRTETDEQISWRAWPAEPPS